jgi:hypothetical protein
MAFAFCQAIHPPLDECKENKIYGYKFSQPFRGIWALVGVVPATWLFRGAEQSSRRGSPACFFIVPSRFLRGACGSANVRGRREGNAELMKVTWRKNILRANGAYLMLASTVGILTTDIPGIYFKLGPQSRLLTAPYAGIGFLEAHGLAFIIGVLLWRAAPARSWHITALAAQALLGISNLLFWQIFPATDSMVAGYIFTSLHWIFVSLQLAAALTFERATSAYAPATSGKAPIHLQV